MSLTSPAQITITVSRLGSQGPTGPTGPTGGGTGDGGTLSNEQVQDIVGAMLTGTETGIDVSYNDTDNDIDFVVSDQSLESSSTGSANLKLTMTNPGVNDDVTLTLAGGLSVGSVTAAGATLTSANDNTTYTAGNGLDLTGTAFSADLKANGGLVIDSTEIAVDLAASSITGTLGVADGGTGATSLTANSLLTGNGTSAVVAESNLSYDGSYLLDVKNDNSSESEIRLYCASSNAHYVGIKGSPHSGSTSHILQLPKVAGSAGQYLKVDSVNGNTQQLIWGDVTVSSITSIINSSLTKIGTATDQEYIDFATSNEVNVKVNNTERLSVTASGVDVTGNLTSTKNVFSKTSNTDHSHQGDVVFFGATTSMTQGDLYYFNSSGNWAQADADAVATSGGVLLAIALGAASDTDGMLLRGVYTMDAAAVDDNEATGDELYVSTTAGHVTNTAPTGNLDIVRVVGYCLDGTNGQIWFNPSNDFIEITA